MFRAACSNWRQSPGVLSLIWMFRLSKPSAGGWRTSKRSTEENEIPWQFGKTNFSESFCDMTRSSILCSVARFAASASWLRSISNWMSWEQDSQIKWRDDMSLCDIRDSKMKKKAARSWKLEQQMIIQHWASGGYGKNARTADTNSAADFPGTNRSSIVKSPMMKKLMIAKLAPVKLKEIELLLSHSSLPLMVKLLVLDQAAAGAKIRTGFVPRCELSLTEHLLRGDGSLLRANRIEGSSSPAKDFATDWEMCGQRCSRIPLSSTVSSVNGFDRTEVTSWLRSLRTWRRNSECQWILAMEQDSKGQGPM